MVASFGNLQIGVMPWRQANAGGRHQIGERVMRFRQVLVHGGHDGVGVMGASNGEHVGVLLVNQVLACAQTSGDDDFSIFGKGFTDCIQRLFNCFIDESAGIDDNQIGCIVGRGYQVTLGTKFGQNALGVDQGFRATQRNESDRRSLSDGTGWQSRQSCMHVRERAPGQTQTVWVRMLCSDRGNQSAGFSLVGRRFGC